MRIKGDSAGYRDALASSRILKIPPRGPRSSPSKPRRSPLWNGTKSGKACFILSISAFQRAGLMFMHPTNVWEFGRS
jgi:hypothetical protein